MEKTKVFNLIILDKSGSMERLHHAAVKGFNEVTDGIRQSQEEHRATQEHHVSLVLFSAQDTVVFYDEVPIDSVRQLRIEDYRPYGMTPLYDAVGMALCRMEEHMAKASDAAVVVTIITDGKENASREYTLDSIRRFIDCLSEKGWAFALFGANQDAQQTAQAMGIRNARNFAYDERGVSDTFAFTSRMTIRFSNSLDDFRRKESDAGVCCSPEERRQRYSLMANDAFDEEEQTK